MSSGNKSKKKTKGKTLPLFDFLAKEGDENPHHTVRTINWADDVEDEHDGYMMKTKESISIPTAPRAARDPDFNEENVPNKPPFTVYLTNLPYDFNQDDLAAFFQDLKVANIQIPTSDGSKSKGFGYVEFDDRQSLIEALKMSNMSIKNRRVKIEVSNNANDDRRGRMNRDNRRDDRYSDPDRMTGDWRSGPRDELPYEGDRYRYRSGGFEGRRDDRERETGSSDNRPGGWREGGGERSSSFADRDKDREWSRDRDRGGSFGPRRYGDSDRDRNNVVESAEPKSRPKIKILPRTKPIEPIVVQPEENVEKSEEKKEEADKEEKEETKVKDVTKVKEVEAKPRPTPTPSVNIFGSAKPVDTTAREREIEQRLTRTYTEFKPKDDNDADKREPYRPPRETWSRRNGENREDREKVRGETWRSDEDRGRSFERTATRSHGSSRDYRGDSRGPPPRSSGSGSRSANRSSESRPQVERERKSDHDEEVTKMPKAKEEEAPNFIASNKYSMLPDDVEPDNDIE